MPAGDEEPAEPGSPATILVVDDEPLITMALEAALIDAGFAVVTAANGRQGLDRLAEHPRPDLVLLDMMMPVMNGEAMFKAMHNDALLRRIPVVVMSSLPEASIRARLSDVAALLQKPYTMDQVLAVIGRLLG